MFFDEDFPLSASTFDPYHRWLGIPPDQRPPTLFQLLGISPQENDREVIREAAIRQSSHLRAYQNGPHGALCSRLLNEIAQAQRILVDPAKRKQYQAQLGRTAVAPRPKVPLPQQKRVIRLDSRHTPEKSTWPIVVLLAGAILVVAGGLSAAVFSGLIPLSRSTSRDIVQGPTQPEHPQPPDPGPEIRKPDDQQSGPKPIHQLPGKPDENPKPDQNPKTDLNPKPDPISNSGPSPERWAQMIANPSPLNLFRMRTEPVPDPEPETNPN